jgi:ferritin-like protein
VKNIEEMLSRPVNRRSFIKNGTIAASTATVGMGLFGHGLTALAQDNATGSLTKGDIAILRFLAAAEIIETDLWLQYAELGGVQDNELPGLTGGNITYTSALNQLDGDMAQYIHDNTEDELTHETFINAYLVSKGAPPVNLDHFRTLPSSKATGAQQIGRLTNLMQLTVDTSWWTRLRSRTQNPDFGDTFPQAIPSLAVGQHTAIPRSDRDLSSADFTQAIANTAGFHFAFIEQGGASLYIQLAQRVTNVEALRVVLSIGGVEIAHFQTWHDKAGNAPNVTNVIDPVTGVKVTFPNLNTPPFGGEDFQTNLIMPEPTEFLSKQLPPVSIIRPSETKGAAVAFAKALIGDGLFIGQTQEFFAGFLQLAQEADAAQRRI